MCQRRLSLDQPGHPSSLISLHCQPEEGLDPYFSKSRHWRLGRCPGWSESSLGAWINVLVLSCTGSIRSSLAAEYIKPSLQGVPVRGWAGWPDHLLIADSVWHSQIITHNFSNELVHLQTLSGFAIGLPGFTILLEPTRAFEPPRNKTNNVAVCTAKTQISLGIRPVWSESLLSAWRKRGPLATHWVHSEDADQTGRMPKLIWVFAGRTATLLVLSQGGSFIQKVFIHLNLFITPFVATSFRI